MWSCIWNLCRLADFVLPPTMLTSVYRFVPSQADVAVFDAISAQPPADLCHALRWYNHIKSYQAQKNR